MSYCTVDDVKLVLLSNTGKLKIGGSGHIDTTSCEAMISIAERKVQASIRKIMPTGGLPTDANVPDDLRYATAYATAAYLMKSNYYGQFNVKSEGVGDFFNDESETFLNLFIDNYRAGVYEDTYSGITSGPLISNEDATSYTSFPKYPLYTNIFDQDDL